MRVLHLLKTSVGATWAWRQIHELVRLGVDVHVALPGGGPMEGHYSAVGATEYLLQTDFPFKAPWMFPKLAGKFRKLVDELCPDIIHSHFVGTTLTMRLALGRNHPVPRVFQVPGPLHLEHRFFRNAEIATAGDNDHWVGSCRWTCDRYRRSGIVNKRIFLSYYGTDIDTFHGSPSGTLRRELGLGQGTKIIGMVAYMYAPKRYLGQRRGLKGHEDLIDAVALCLRHIPDMVCVIVGGAGWTAPPGNVGALADALLEALGEQEEKHALRRQCARRRIEENFSIERMVKTYREVWEIAAKVTG